VEKAGGRRYRVFGRLTIRDVTREVVLEVQDRGRSRDREGNEHAAFLAKSSVNRRDFGLAWSALLETGGVLVADQVEIELEVQATRSAASRAA
jgi:polyisoprenoid-binding protein YceI